jgi:integrase
MFKRLTVKQTMHAEPPAGRRAVMLPDGGNLYLQVVRDKTHPDRLYRSFVLRYELAGRRHDLGLGGTHTVSLAEAREKARKYRQDLLDRVDPLLERRKQHRALIAERAKAITFKQVAEDYLDLHLDSFKNAKHRQQWRNTLAQYAYPKIGHMTVADISPPDVLRIIEPLWKTKKVTASRVRQRIERVLDYATTRQYRSGDNPAARVIDALPKQKNGKEHHAALPYAELPIFMGQLRARDSLAARALEFAILTAARTGEVLGATWDEIDLDARLWTVPAGRMKAGREHRAALCGRAVEILRGLGKRNGKDKIFPISDVIMLRLLKSMRPDITTHGFRSTFMDWAHEQTPFPKAVIDMALAHAIGDRVEAAYRRGDLFEKRRKLMSAWAAHCGRPPADTAKVIPITAAH